MMETFSLFGPKRTMLAAGLACLIAATGASAHDNRHHNKHHNKHHDQHASLGPYVVGDQGVIYAGGNYDISPSDGYPTTMSDQSYVFFSNPGEAQ